MRIYESQQHTILRTAPVLEVNSRTVRKMRDFFVDQLGFVVGNEVGTGPAFVTLDRDGQTVMLNCRSLFGFRKSGWAVYFWTDDIEALFRDITSRGTISKNGIVTKDYGSREFVVTAPDSREIVFGQISPDQGL